MNSARAVRSSFRTPIAPYRAPDHRSRFLDEMAKQDGEIEICLKLERCFQQPTKLGWVFDRSIGHDAVRSPASPGSGAKAK